MPDVTEAHEQTDFEMQTVPEKFALPVSTPAIFTHDAAVERAEGVTDRLERTDVVPIAPYAKTGEDGGLYFSSKVYVSRTNEFCHIKLTDHHVRIFPKDSEFSEATLAHVIRVLSRSLNTELHLKTDT